MLNGFWTVTFRAATDIGAGVVAINEGKATGGDGSFTYIGPLTTCENGTVTGELKISRHSKFHPSVLPGLDNYSLLVSGTVTDDSLTLSGRIKGHEAQVLAIHGKRVAPI